MSIRKKEKMFKKTILTIIFILLAMPVFPANLGNNINSNEFPMSDQISHNYMQPGDIEIQRAIDDINKIIVKVDVHYIDGAENTDYYRMESTSDYNINRIDIYKL